MKVVIIGGVAAGTKVAAKLKREMPEAEIVIYTKGKDISYAGCGLPYYIGGSIKERQQLIVNSPEKFMGLTGTEVHTESEVVSVCPECKNMTLKSGEVIEYDKLVIASGAEPFIPPVEGVYLKGVFSVRTPDDAIYSRAYIQDNGVKNAVVVGGGFIGLEVAENLIEQGLKVTLIDMAPQIMPNVFDREMADYAKKELIKGGMAIHTGTSLNALIGEDRVTGVETSIGIIPAEIVYMSVGIRPATAFLEHSGIEMFKGTILVNDYAETNVKDVYAVGDCAMVRNRITGKPQWSAMGSTANIAGRAMAVSISGTDFPHPGVLGTGVVKLSSKLNAARTGLTEEQARKEGYDTITSVSVHDDKAHYYYDHSIFVIKVVADRNTRKLLGVQVFGSGSVDKVADIAVTGISMKARVDDFIAMDFAYAPPFSTAIHPFAQACTVLMNKITGKMDSMTPVEFRDGKAEGYHMVDMQPAPSVMGTEWYDLTRPEVFEKNFKKDDRILLICARGKRAYLTQVKLRALGFTATKVLEGGDTFNYVNR